MMLVSATPSGQQKIPLRSYWLGSWARRRGVRGQGQHRLIQPRGQLEKWDLEGASFPPSINIPTLLNTTPYPSEKRQFFYKDAAEGLEAALADGQKRMTITSLMPELNPECDVYRIGTLLEMVREFAFRSFTSKNKRIKICVQQSLGSGALTGMPLALSGVNRILENMDWNGFDDAELIGFGRLGKGQVEDNDSAVIIIAPQNIVGGSVIPLIEELCEEAGDRPVILFNPKVGDVASSSNVMSIRGRAERMAVWESFRIVYAFRLLYKKPYFFPIYGALRYTYGSTWDIYKRQGKRKVEKYSYLRSFYEEPSPEQITKSIFSQ